VTGHRSAYGHRAGSEASGHRGLALPGDLCSVVVLASAYCTTHGAEDPQDHTNDHQQEADCLQDGDAGHHSQDNKHNSENDQLRFLPSCMDRPCTGLASDDAINPAAQLIPPSHSASAGN
jgi:hypothetical protein